MKDQKLHLWKNTRYKAC